MKQNKGYNWSGHPVGNTYSYYAYVSRLKQIPTAKQIKYQSFLCAVLQEKGLQPMLIHGRADRRGYMNAISKNVDLAKANGIDLSREAQDEYWKGVSADGGE